MTTVAIQSKSPVLNIVDQGFSLDDLDRELQSFEAQERARLGLEPTEHWVEKMANLTFTQKERPTITMLIGGLTMAHDQLLQRALSAVGYNVKALDVPSNEAFQTGKEFGNRGQCNPTYFTVGNLVKHLIDLRDNQGLSTQEIIDNYVFFTAGACGPCRFGMYTTEYRKALRDAGFDGFRVVLFQQQGGLKQATGDESGLELTPKFFLQIIKSLLVGDVINGIAYRLRPYEVVPGATDKAVEEVKALCFDALSNHRSLLWTMFKARSIFSKVEVDRLQLKPKVAIIGEFWAMTTEGDGNYALQRFLESEGAECDIQFVTAWLLYNIWEVAFDIQSRATLRGHDGTTKGLAGTDEWYAAKMRVLLWAADKGLRVLFQTVANVAGFHNYHLPNMDAVAEVAAPYYNNDLRGGEGHMEVGKLILNVVKNKATMTLSVKPFGCMPSSSVSDGVQSLITEQFPGTIYCPVETSGDGAVNFYSRVQMYLFKAKQAVEREVQQALTEHGLTLDEVRAFVAKHPRLRASLHKPDHAGSATVVDVIHEVAALRNKTRLQRLAGRATRAARGLRALVQRTPGAVEAAASVGRQAAGEIIHLGVEKAKETVLQRRAG